MDKTKMAVEVFDKLAERYQEKYMDVSLYHGSFDIFCGHIKKNGTLLDVACGPGNITRYLLEKRPDLKILGIDLAPNMIRLARINNPQADFKIMDCKAIGTLTEKYDALMAGFFFPYLSKEDVFKFIKDASDLLQPGGMLYISTMEDNYERSGLESSSSGDQVFMHYHEAGYLAGGLEENNFSVIDLQRKTYTTKNGPQATDLLLIAQKQ